VVQTEVKLTGSNLDIEKAMKMGHQVQQGRTLAARCDLASKGTGNNTHKQGTDSWRKPELTVKILNFGEASKLTGQAAPP
jgi:hypothetical protein